jgi:hypothetical protein
MSSEEKLKELLLIALKNGWTPDNTVIEVDEVFIYKDRKIVCFASYGTEESIVSLKISLDTLVSGWEEQEISFIDAIAFGMKYDIDETDPFDRTEPRQIPSYWFRNMWVNQPTSQRLDWLFDTFKHLL